MNLTRIAEMFAPARFVLGAAALPLVLLLGASGASAQNLASFAVLGGSTVTNTGPSVITGNVGVSPGSAITGFPPGIVTAPYTIYRNNAVAAQAQSDLTTAYNVLAGRPSTANLTGQNLGGMTLVAGVYSFNSSAQLTGTLTFDAQGDPNAVFVINVGSTLTTAAGSRVALINGAQAANIYYRVGSSATLGAATLFQGKILALTSITLITGATIDCGAALARNGAVVLDTNRIVICVARPLVPIVPGVPVVPGGPVPSVTSSNIAQAIADYIAAGGILPFGFQVLGVLTPAELVAALAQLSGETATAVGPSAFQSMDQFMTLAQGRRGPGVVSITSDDMEPDTISVMGYAAAGKPVAAFEGLDGSDRGTREAALWEIWAAVYGGYSSNAGDPGVGTRDVISRNYGYATGVDYRVSANGTIGLSVGTGGTSFSLSDDGGDGRSKVFETALYGRKDFNRAYISGALGYAFNSITTDRLVTFAGFDHFSAAFNAHTVAAEIEVGYHVGIFTPYAALRGQALFVPAYSETTTSGNSTFALSYAAYTARALRSELGVRVDWERTFDSGAGLELHGQAAWAHDYLTNAPLTASFQALPGSSFQVAGASPAADSLLLSAGTDLSLVNGVTLGASVNGAFTRNAQSYGGALKFGYRW